jgi:hypothetical protein
MSTGNLSGVPNGFGDYEYTLTLNNSPASTADIQTFWFAWLAGQGDFMASSPYAVQTPQGWSYSVQGGGSRGDGYSIKFITFTAPLAPGNSLVFHFESADSPAAMAGRSVPFPQYPTLSSDVYSGHTAGILDQIVVQPVPEPSVWALFGAGALALGLVLRRNILA